jgi:hypothetical protein
MTALQEEYEKAIRENEAAAASSSGHTPQLPESTVRAIEVELARAKEAEEALAAARAARAGLETEAREWEGRAQSLAAGAVAAAGGETRFSVLLSSAFSTFVCVYFKETV